MTDPTSRPLWRVMQDAYSPEACGGNYHLDYAAELRAIADWLEAMWAAQAQLGDIPSAFVEGLAIGREIHREGTIKILRAEADRAEAGE